MKKKAISNREKLLLVIYEMSLEQKGTLKHEDISVRAFKKYPDAFQLRGYSKYPDTEHTSKRLYDLRREGFIKVHSKFILLTEKGKTHAKDLIKGEFTPLQKRSKKLSRDIISEIERIRNTDAFRLFEVNKKDQIVDTDFFSFLGTSVRAERTDFRARIKTIEDIVEKVKTCSDCKSIVELHAYLLERFKDAIKTKLSIGFPRRKHE